METPLISIREKACISCYSCVKACPVKAIELHESSEIPYINNKRCIGCGECYHACPTHAIEYLNSIEDTVELLKNHKNTIAIVDPSIAAEFDDIKDYRKFVKMIESLGFEHIHEVAFGVDIVAKQYDDLISNFMGKYYLFSNCPSITAYIEKFHPTLIENCAPIVNPMIATAKVVKSIYGEDTKITSIGPCISAKMEALKESNRGLVDTVLTFRELRVLFKRFGVKESSIEFSDFTPPLGYKGSMYPISEGILYASGVNCDLLKGNVITVDGKQNSLNAVSEFSNSIDDIQKHFNLFFCEGCAMGPGMKRQTQKLMRHVAVQTYAQKRLKDFNFALWNENISKYRNLGYSQSFKDDNQQFDKVSDEKINEIIGTLNKDSNFRLNCGRCGYGTCANFAEALANNITRPDLCVVNSLKNKTQFIKDLQETNEKLQKQYNELQQAEKQASIDKNTYKEEFDNLNLLIQKVPIALVLVNEDLKVISSNSSFVNILGSEAQEINEIIPGLTGADLKNVLPVHFHKLFTYVLSSNEDIVGRDISINDKSLLLSIFSLKQNKIAAGVLKDMQVLEVRNEEVINRVTEVIDQNFDLVQKIAFLLGEGASTTEKMLNSIITFDKKEDN